MKYLMCYEIPFAHASGSIPGHAIVELKNGLTEQGLADAARDILEHEQKQTRQILKHTIWRSVHLLSND